MFRDALCRERDDLRATVARLTAEAESMRIVLSGELTTLARLTAELAAVRADSTLTAERDEALAKACEEQGGTGCQKEGATMTPTELADALASIPFDPSVTVSATHAAAILDASHALRRLGRVEDAAEALLAAATCPEGDHAYNCDVRLTEGACDCHMPALRVALRAE